MYNIFTHRRILDKCAVTSLSKTEAGDVLECWSCKIMAPVQHTEAFVVTTGLIRQSNPGHEKLISAKQEVSYGTN